MMKRALTAIAVTALIAGCQHDEPQKPMTRAETAQAAAASNSSGMAKPTVATKPPSAKEYYEVTQDGKIYVFGTLDGLLAFRQTGALPAKTVEKPAFGAAGETVVFEAGGLEPGLMAEYQKSHPKK
jgi:hypothetical protein